MVQPILTVLIQFLVILQQLVVEVAGLGMGRMVEVVVEVVRVLLLNQQQVKQLQDRETMAELLVIIQDNILPLVEVVLEQ